MPNTIEAYKVFNPDWTCLGFQFEVGKSYIHQGELKVCSSGFHACLRLPDCFSYYRFSPKNKVARVLCEDYHSHERDSKVVCRKITILEELSWERVLILVNSGDWNSGHGNSGFFNSLTPNTIQVFNSPCDRLTWENADKPDFIFFDLTQWVSEEDMTDEEKAKHPHFHVTRGYLKSIFHKDAWKRAWGSASEEDKKKLLALPNFDAKVFKEISGIDVTK